MQILIQTPTGRKFRLETEDWNTVLNIKEKIQEREGIPPDQQRLTYEGKQLTDDDVFLDQIKLIQSSKEELIQSPSSIVTLCLTLRLRGGGNVIAPRQVQIRHSISSDSEYDVDDFSDSLSHHQLEQTARSAGQKSERTKDDEHFSYKTAIADDLPAIEREQVINSKCTGHHVCSPKLSSKGSRGPRWFITNKLGKWNPWNCCRCVQKHV